MKNIFENAIFENAVFGDKFTTRDGRTAIYLWKNKNNEHSLMVKGIGKKQQHYDNEGKWYSQNGENNFDIISADGDCEICCENCKWNTESGPCNHDTGVGKHITTCFVHKNYNNEYDEAELREKSWEWTSFVKNDNPMIKTIALECAMIGYRKAKEGL